MFSNKPEYKLQQSSKGSPGNPKTTRRNCNLDMISRNYSLTPIHHTVTDRDPKPYSCSYSTQLWNSCRCMNYYFQVKFCDVCFLVSNLSCI